MKLDLKLDFVFAPVELTFLSCVQLQRWNNKKDTSEPLFWFSAGLWTINCFCQWTAAQMSRDCDVYTRWKFAFSDIYGGCLDKSR